MAQGSKGLSYLVSKIVFILVLTSSTVLYLFVHWEFFSSPKQVSSSSSSVVPMTKEEVVQMYGTVICGGLLRLIGMIGAVLGHLLSTVVFAVSTLFVLLWSVIAIVKTETLPLDLLTLLDVSINSIALFAAIFYADRIKSIISDRPVKTP